MVKFNKYLFIITEVIKSFLLLKNYHFEICRPSIIEIQIIQDTDTTPITLSGTVESSFPINFTSIDLRCNGNYIQSLYGDGTVNDMSELITYLNSEPDMSYLGTYSDAGDGFVNLEMPTNLVNQFCSSGTLTFEVFND